MTRKKRIVIALGGNALGNTLPEQMAAVKITAHAIVDLIEEGCEVVIVHGNGPQVGMVNNAMLALTHEDAHQPNTPLSVCVAMSQAYIGYDLQNALREELLNRNITDIPVATMITQVRVDEHDPAFACPSKPIGRFLTKEQADEMSQKYDYIMKEDAGRGYRRVVASPKPQEIIEIGTIRTMVDSGDLVIACGGGGIPVIRQGNHLKGASAVIDKDFASALLAKELDKKEVQEGLIKACDVIDLIIEILRGSKSVKDAKACLTQGITENIKFKSQISKKMAAMLRFTERQASAILEMRLYKLIGLEIEALQKEHETTLKNIARYEDILNHYDSMATLIMEELDAFKKEYGRKRRTAIENAEAAVFEEKKVEEQEVIFLMDRFGYAKTVDVSVYERNKEAADSENKYVVNCLNTGKICLFTDTGKMHQIKVMDLPYGRFRDKGVPIDNVSNYSSSEEQIVTICDAQQIAFEKLLFATKQGMIKRVDGSEFQVAKRTIAATKLQEEDALIHVGMVQENQNIVLQTRDGYFLRFLTAEIPEKKKGAVGVRGIKLQKTDELEQIHLFEEGTDTKVKYGEKEVTLNRLKLAKRDGVGTKQRK
jgi:carbamate kinase